MYKRTTFKIKECEIYGLSKDDVKLISNKTTDKQFSGVDMRKLLKLICNNIEYEKTTNIECISYECKYLGHTNITDNTIGSNIYCISSIEENKYGTRFITLYHINDGNNSTYKVSRSSFQDHPCDVGDIVKCIIRQQYKRKKDDNGKWIEDKDNIETIIKDYTIIKKCD